MIPFQKILPQEAAQFAQDVQDAKQETESAFMQWVARAQKVLRPHHISLKPKVIWYRGSTGQGAVEGWVLNAVALVEVDPQYDDPRHPDDVIDEELEVIPRSGTDRRLLF